MREVRVKVKLSNSYDESRRQRGEISQDAVRQYEANALIDTGAVPSVISANVVKILALLPLGQRVAEYADGRKHIVELTEPVSFNIIGRETEEGAMVLGDEVIIGQTILEVLDLQVDCRNQKLIPNPAHPDQPVVKIK
jgi:clan AA aspartic protease